MRPGGYAWWYLDALSDDGATGLTIIAFVGSVFSPYYRWARRGGAGDPENHCALNVVLYGRGAHRFCMTERPSRSIERTASSFALGRSSVRIDGARLIVEIDEVAAPIPRRVRGRVVLHVGQPTDYTATLDAAGRHRWSPIDPNAHVEVALQSPEARWSGPAYLDMNEGDEALETGFSHWDWSRATLAKGAGIVYDVTRSDGTVQCLSLRVGRDGRVETMSEPPRITLPRTGWRLRRETRLTDALVARTLTDSPFYARSLVSGGLFGERVTAMHESLDCGRFVNPLVQFMLPFRMPRWAASAIPRAPDRDAVHGVSRPIP